MIPFMEIQEQHTPICHDKDQNNDHHWEGLLTWTGKEGDYWSAENILYIDLGCYYVDTYICEN